MHIIAPADYLPLNRTYTIPSGSIQYLVPIVIVADSGAESLENFTIVTTNASINAVILDPIITVTIIDGNGKI